MCGPGQIESLSQKMFELKGRKRPNLKRVKKSADAVLGALTETKSMKADFKAKLKTVKKEEEKVSHNLEEKTIYSNLCLVFALGLRKYPPTYLQYSNNRCFQCGSKYITCFKHDFLLLPVYMIRLPVHRKRRLTGVRTWKPCQGWRAGKRCLLHSKKHQTKKNLFERDLGTWPAATLSFISCRSSPK